MGSVQANYQVQGVRTGSEWDPSFSGVVVFSCPQSASGLSHPLGTLKPVVGGSACLTSQAQGPTYDREKLNIGTWDRMCE